MQPPDWKTKCEVAVVGLGVMGSAATCELAKKRMDVCAFEQFDAPNNRGSSHGESRVIRMAYFEGPFYVKLLQEAYKRWDELQSSSEKELFRRVGLLEAGYPGSELVAGVLEAAKQNDLTKELGSRERLVDLPQFHIPGDWDVVFERNAGYLRPELVVSEFLRVAAEEGANLYRNTKVLGIRPRADSFVIETSAGTVEAGSVIVTAGPWMTSRWVEDLLPELRPRLQLTRQDSAWFKPRRPELFARTPVFALEVAKDKIFYGFPNITGNGVKVATHTHGDAIENPDDIVPPPKDEDFGPLKAFLREYLPDAVGPIGEQQTCIYTNTSDGHFLIDRHPSHPKLIFASPCSGHGFKFASIFGPILADMALGEEARFKEFKIDRFALSAPVSRLA